MLFPLFGICTDYCWLLHLGLSLWFSWERITCNVGDLGSFSGLGRSPGEGKVYPLHSGLENSTDCIAHGAQRVRHN